MVAYYSMYTFVQYINIRRYSVLPVPLKEHELYCTNLPLGFKASASLYSHKLSYTDRLEVLYLETLS